MNPLFQLCLDHQITPNQLFLLHCFKNKTRPPLINLEGELVICKVKELITDDNKLTAKAETLLVDCEAYFKKTKVKTTSASLGDDYQDKVKTYRNIFPSGQHPTLGYTFRSSIEELTPKFVWFFNKYPEYDWDLVFKATQTFITKAIENNYRGLGKAGLFIKKIDKESNVATSALADMCQDLLEGHSSSEQYVDTSTRII